MMLEFFTFSLFNNLLISFLIFKDLELLSETIIGLFIYLFGALGQTRTGTPKRARILSPLCLPISPRGHISLSKSFILLYYNLYFIKYIYSVKKILIYNSGGGLGDSIQIIPLILSLKNHYRRSDIFYLGAHPNHFEGKLKEYNIKIQTFNLSLNYFGFRWWHYFFVKKNFNKKNEVKFDLIIDLQSKFRNTLILKRIPHNHFYSTTFGNLFSTKKVKYKTKDHLKNLNIFLEDKIKVVNFNCSRLPKNLINEAKKLLPKSNYIGFSITQGNEYRKKSWSIYKFISLANKSLIKKKTPVFFIEKNQEHIIEKIKNQVPGALFPETKSELSCPALVTALSSRLDQAISIDNGIMHMISLADIPMVVLFGPTNSEKFAPKNNYTKILDSKKIYSTQDIDSITVDEVYNLI